MNLWRTARRGASRAAMWLLASMLSVAVAQDLEDRVVEHTLDNGMKLLLMRRTQSPTVALQIWVKAGSVDEPLDKTGIAHMLEHMLFKGTKELGTTDYEAEMPLLDKLDELVAEHDELKMRDGLSEEETARRDELAAEIEATQDELSQYVVSNQVAELYSYEGQVGLNAGTSTDYTNYVISLPANKIELWMRIEAERMRDPIFREFYKERDVVMEERKQRIEANPFGRLLDGLLTTAFVAHPYGTPIIGWESDIARLKRKEAAAFFKTYYAPNNAIVSIVGDIDTDWVIERMTQYFGDIPPQEIPSRVGTREPEQVGERRTHVVYDAEPRIQIGWHKPTVPSFEDFVFDVIDGLLTSGRTSRLYKALVEEQQVAVSVRSVNGYPGARFPNIFLVDAVPLNPHTPEEIEKALYAEIEKLKTGEIEERELQKVRNQFAASFIRGLDSNSGMANQLGYFELIAGSWRYVETLQETVNRITAEDVQRVATEYLTWENRTVAILVKESPESSGDQSETDIADEGEAGE